MKVVNPKPFAEFVSKQLQKAIFSAYGNPPLSEEHILFTHRRSAESALLSSVGSSETWSDEDEETEQGKVKKFLQEILSTTNDRFALNNVNVLNKQVR